MTTRPFTRAAAAAAAAALVVSLAPAPVSFARSTVRIPDSPQVAASAAARAARLAQAQETSRTVIVSTRPGADVASTLASIGPVPAATVRPLGNWTFAVELPPGSDVASSAAALNRAPQVTGVCRDVPVRLASAAEPDDPEWTTPSDPSLLPFGQRSYLGARAHGFTYSVDAAPAWARALGTGGDRLPPGRAGVKIGVLDTGYAFTAPTFDSTSAIVPGWDYADHDADPTDHSAQSHGTWVTNIIRAQTGNASQMAGAMGALPGTVVVYKIFTDAGVGDLSTMIAAINGAANAGCKVINISAGIVHAAQGFDVVEPMGHKIEFLTGNSRGHFPCGRPHPHRRCVRRQSQRARQRLVTREEGEHTPRGPVLFPPSDRLETKPDA
jgi:hypothetical protein